MFLDLVSLLFSIFSYFPHEVNMFYNDQLLFLFLPSCISGNVRFQEKL